MKDKGTDTKKVTIGSRFRELRENYNDRGMTQETCADLLQISLALYGRIENDRAVPSTAVLIAAANLFGVSVDYLLCRTDFRTGAGGEYFAKLTGLSDDAISALIKNRHSAAIEYRNSVFQDSYPAAAYNLIPDVVSYLLRAENQDVLNLIGNYVIADDLVLSGDVPPVLKTPNINGSGLTFDTAEVLRSAIPNMILQRLHDLRRNRLRNRAKKGSPRK